MEEDILLVDKPVGISSFDVIRRLRREYKEKGLPVPKMGHAGTLDPLASGLMIIGVGSGTKKLNAYLKKDKEYVTDILIGEKRSTGDMEGQVVAEKAVNEPIPRELCIQILRDMIGMLRLPVSAYSAVKQDGVPMYKRARKAEREGVILESPLIRDMEVMDAEYLGQTCGEGRCIVSVRFYVGSGTYIRSLGEEFGRRIGYPATLSSLRRTKIDEFDIKDARKI